MRCCTTGARYAYTSTRVLANCRFRLLRPLTANLDICWTWASFVLLQDPGPLSCIWYQGAEQRTGDWHALNHMTMSYRCLIFLFKSLRPFLSVTVALSKIDFIKAFHPIPMASGDVARMMHHVPFELYEFVSMKFGLRSAAQTFRRLIAQEFQDLLLFPSTDLDHLTCPVLLRKNMFDTRHFRCLSQRLSESAVAFLDFRFYHSWVITPTRPAVCRSQTYCVK